MLLPISARVSGSSEASPSSTSLSGTPAPLLPIRARTRSNLELGAVGQERPRSRTDGQAQGLLGAFGPPSPSGSGEKDDDSIQISVKNTFIDFGTSDTIDLHKMGAQTCQARLSEPKPTFFMDFAEDPEESPPSEPASQKLNLAPATSTENADSFFDEVSPLSQYSRSPKTNAGSRSAFGFEESLPLDQRAGLSPRTSTEARNAFHSEESSPLGSRSKFPNLVNEEARNAFHFEDASRGNSGFQEFSNSVTSVPAYSGRRPSRESPKASQLPDVKVLFFMSDSDSRTQKFDDSMPEVHRARKTQAMPFDARSQPLNDARPEIHQTRTSQATVVDSRSQQFNDPMPDVYQVRTSQTMPFDSQFQVYQARTNQTMPFDSRFQQFDDAKPDDHQTGTNQAMPFDSRAQQFNDPIPKVHHARTNQAMPFDTRSQQFHDARPDVYQTRTSQAMPFNMRSQHFNDARPDVHQARTTQSMPKYVSVPSAAPTSPAPGLNTFGYSPSALESSSQASFPAPSSPAYAAPWGLQDGNPQYDHVLCQPPLSPPANSHSALAGESTGFNSWLERPGRMARPNNMFVDTSDNSGLFQPTAHAADIQGLSPSALGVQMQQPNPGIYSRTGSGMPNQQPWITPTSPSGAPSPNLSSLAQIQQPAPMAPGCLGTSPKSYSTHTTPKSVASLSSPKSFASPSSRQSRKHKTPAFPSGSRVSAGSNAHGKLNADGQPTCQPCAWFYKESGCLNAASCRYCHMCPQGELKNRKKEKVARLRSEEAAESASKQMDEQMIPDQPGLLSPSALQSRLKPETQGTRSPEDQGFSAEANAPAAGSACLTQPMTAGLVSSR